jgi:hypothetical protein
VFEWIAVIILWYLTWEHVLNTQQARNILDSFRAKWNKPQITWPMIFVGALAVTVGCCRTAAQVVVDFVSKAPHGVWRTFLEGIHRHFVPYT